MKTFIKWIQPILIGALIILLILQQQCGGGCPEQITIETHDTIKGDSIPYPIEVLKPYPVAQIVPPDTFWRYTDTATTLAQCHKMAVDYNTMRIYTRIMKDDSDGYVKTIDTVFRNELLSGTLFFMNPRPTIINNTYVEQKKRVQVYAGLDIGYDFKDTWRLAPTVLILDKKYYGYEYSFDIPSRMHDVTVLYKFHKKARK